MKILVDELPYEKEDCLFYERCIDMKRYCPIDNEDYNCNNDECQYYKKMSSHQDYMDKLIKEVQYAMEEFYE